MRVLIPLTILVLFVILAMWVSIYWYRKSKIKKDWENYK